MVYTISHTDMGGGYTTPNVTDFEGDLETEVDEYPSDCGYSREHIRPFIETLTNLLIGEKAEMGPWVIKCSVMPEKVYENLGEFVGW